MFDALVEGTSDVNACHCSKKSKKEKPPCQHLSQSKHDINMNAVTQTKCTITSNCPSVISFKAPVFQKTYSEVNTWIF